MVDTLLEYATAIGRETIRFSLPNRYQALNFTRTQADVIARILNNWGLQEAIVEFPNCKRPIRIPAIFSKTQPAMIENVLAPGIQIHDLLLTPPIFKVFEYFLENPDIPGGLVRRSDNHQIALTAASQRMILGGATVKDAVKRKRSDYWFLGDLETYMRQSQQQLEPNNPNSILEFSWRGCDRKRENWRQFTNRYRLIEANGVLYECSIGLGVKSLPTAPVA
jgi:hypothetical protein